MQEKNNCSKQVENLQELLCLSVHRGMVMSILSCFIDDMVFVKFQK